MAKTVPPKSSEERELYRLILDSAKTWPQKEAIVDRWGSCSFLQLAQDVEALRHKLLSVPISTGQGVGLIAPNSREFIIGLFALLGCGATVVPIASETDPGQILDFIREYEISHVLVAGGSAANQAFGSAVTTFEGLSGDFYFNLVTSSTGDGVKASRLPFVSHIPDAAFIRFTSGTTGRSKGVIFSDQSVLERTEVAYQSLGLEHSDRIVWVLPMAYHFVVSIVLYVRYGMTIIVVPEERSTLLGSYVTKHSGTILYGAPSTIEVLVREPLKGGLPPLRMVISTSTNLSESIGRKFQDYYRIPVSQIFGIIEVGLPIGNLHDQRASVESVGKPLPGYQATLLDRSYNPVPVGEVGMLAIRGPGMFDGYLEPPCKREDILVNGWFITGDLARQDTDGCITIVGRDGSTISIGSEEVFPVEVENILNSHPSVRLSRVFGKTEALPTPRLCAELLLEQGVAFDQRAFETFCAQHLQKSQIPDELVVVPSIPTTGTGKIIRH